MLGANNSDDVKSGNNRSDKNNKKNNNKKNTNNNKDNTSNNKTNKGSNNNNNSNNDVVEGMKSMLEKINKEQKVEVETDTKFSGYSDFQKEFVSLLTYVLRIYYVCLFVFVFVFVFEYLEDNDVMEI